MNRLLRVIKLLCLKVWRYLFGNNYELPDLDGYEMCRKHIESELNLYDKYGFKVRKSRRSEDIWSIYVDGFFQAFIFFTRIVRQKRYVHSECVGNYRYTSKINETTTILFTDKIRRNSNEVANLYLTDKGSASHKKFTVRFLRDPRTVKNRYN